MTNPEVDGTSANKIFFAAKVAHSILLRLSGDDTSAHSMLFVAEVELRCFLGISAS